MHISEFHVVNFKLFKDVKVLFHPELCIFTGVNNSGKTTLLDALALWHECFTKYVNLSFNPDSPYFYGKVGNSQRYYPLEQISSVRFPNFEDIFYQRDRQNHIILKAIFEKDDKSKIEISFSISESGANYRLELLGFSKMGFVSHFEAFFKTTPNPIGFSYASPITSLQQVEAFATQPQINEIIFNRSSVSVLRNRLYALYRHPDVNIFQQFLVDLSFILFNSQQRVEIYTRSDIQRDTRIVFYVKIGHKDIEKDIALLGSGTLQIIEILVNLYSASSSANRDINLILLDEPDSYVHRDVQNRLMQVLTKFIKNNQLFLTTHNESLIRSSDISNLFHMESKPTGVYRSLGSHHLRKIRPKFKGIYPTTLKPVMSELGSTNGLDFINAIEADVLLFVEGEDDARTYDALLKIQSRPKKYAFWVLGGISQVFKNLAHYKTVFSEIKNEKTLWEKSVLIMDRDFLSDQLVATLPTFLQEELDIKNFVTNAYTLESTLLTDLNRLSRLLSNWLKYQGKEVEPDILVLRLEEAYQKYAASKAVDWQQDKFIEDTAHAYKDIREKLKEILKKKSNPGFIRENDIQIQTLVRSHLKQVLLEGAYYKLMDKEDVEVVINEALMHVGLTFSIETNFIELIHLVDKSTWMSAWDFLLTI